MAEERNNQTRSNDNSNTPRTGIIDRVFGTSSSRTSGQSEQDGRTSSSRTINGTADSERTGESNPQFTRPNSLESFMDEKEKPRTGTRTTKTTIKSFVSSEACGNICAGIADGFSWLLTQTPVLGLNAQEEQELGENLHETLNYFPATSPFVKAVNWIAPWAGLIHVGTKIIWKRVQFIAAHRVQKQQPPPSWQKPETRETFAPDPSLVNGAR